MATDIAQEAVKLIPSDILEEAKKEITEIGHLKVDTARAITGKLAHACKVVLRRHGKWGTRGFRVSRKELQDCIDKAWDKIKTQLSTA